MLCEILVAIVFGLDIFWPKVTFLLLNVPRVGGGSTGLGIIPKKYQFFLVLPLKGKGIFPARICTYF